MSVRILIGDCREKLRELADESVHCCVSSPPYFGLRDYGVDRQIGLEKSPDEFITALVEVFREVRRVLRKDGTLWLNLGDSYASDTKGSGGVSHSAKFHATTETGRSAGGVVAAQRYEPRKFTHGLKTKDLLMIPARVALALQADGWWLRSDVIWHKPNPMPESVTDRPTSAHEHIFLLAKAERYYFDAEAVKESALTSDREREKFNGESAVDTKKRGWGSHCGTSDGQRNIRNVWTIATQPFGEAHFATFPPALIEPCIKAGCPEGGTVLDPFGGAGTTGLVADRLKRDAIIIELNPEYAAMAERRIRGDAPMFTQVSAA